MERDRIPFFGTTQACGEPTGCAAVPIYLHALDIPETLHQLRHRFGTNVLKATGNLRVAQEALRHESPVSTAIYTLVDVADVRDAVQRAARLA